MSILLPLLLAGTVITAEPRRDGDAIVTVANVHTETGAELTIVQLGGTIDGIGMTYSHQPALLVAGDRVEIEDGMVTRVLPRAAFAAPAAGVATYGVQRTRASRTPLWRGGGCLDIVYDEASIDLTAARVLDDAFMAWSDAAATCGRLAVTSMRRANPPATRDGQSTVRIRRGRWCRPATPFEPEVCYAKDSAAVTRLVFVDDPSDADDGKILEADIELNGVDFELALPGTMPSSPKPVLDLLAVATHEAGHALGLAHNCGTGAEEWPADHAGRDVASCDAAGPELRAATMFHLVAPGDRGAASVEATDVAGACELVRELTCESFVEGGCRSSSPTGGGTLLLTIAGLLLMRRRRVASYHPPLAMSAPLPRKIQRFEVVAHLGTGGMGTVYRAHDPQLERDVAIKVLSQASPVATQLSPDDTLDLRGDAATGATQDELLREARMMARLSHPNVLPVYEVGLADGAVFVVMEHIAGRDLASWLEEARGVSAILAVFAQAGRGLAAAHAQGIVHRDFKPANVLVGSDGRVRVADFGLSRMHAPTTAMVRIDDGRGTPRYMAPELWRGASATLASDVYAFCAALDEALGGEQDETVETRDKRLRERGITPRLRQAIHAGLSAEPQARWQLARVVDALEGRRGIAPRWIVAGGLASIALAGGVITLLALGGNEEAQAGCPDAEQWIAQGWNPARHVQIAATIGRGAPAVLDAIDRKQTAIISTSANLCRDLRARSITAQQASERLSCVQRRSFELGAAIDRALRQPTLGTDILDRTSDAVTCLEMTAPPLPADVAPIRALWNRLSEVSELAVPDKSKEHEAGLIALERDALAANEHELALFVQSELAAELTFQDRLEDADQVLQRAYKNALALHATGLTAHILVDRGRLANRRGDQATVANMVELARALADKPDTSPRMKATLLYGMAQAAVASGDYKTAIEHVQKALPLVASLPAERSTELDLRILLVKSYALSEGMAPKAVAEAHVGVARAKELYGERDQVYGTMLNALAFALRSNGDLPGALAPRKQALELMEATLPAGHSKIVFQQMDYAADLSALGRSAEARAQLLLAAEAMKSNEAVRGQEVFVLEMLALTTFEVGEHDEGLRILRQAHEVALSRNGIDHPSTLEVAWLLLDVEVELRRLDDAERTLAAVERGCRARGEAYAQRLQVVLGAYAAELKILRGKPGDAEKLSRNALAALAELRAQPSELRMVQRVLGESLLAQRRYADARAAFNKALDYAKQASEREDQLALLEVALARVDAADGKRVAAIERARGARTVLEKYPAQIVGRRLADELLSASSSSVDRGARPRRP